MNRREAYITMLDGKEIGNKSYYPKEAHCYFDEKAGRFLFSSEEGGVAPIREAMEQEDGYYIYKKEKTIKRVVNIYPHDLIHLHADISAADKAADSASRIACVEIEIKYKEGEGL